MYLVCTSANYAPLRVGSMRGYTNTQSLANLLFEGLQSQIDSWLAYETNQYYTEESKMKDIRNAIRPRTFRKIYRLEEDAEPHKLNKFELAAILLTHPDFQAYTELHGIEVPEQQ